MAGSSLCYVKTYNYFYRHLHYQGLKWLSCSTQLTSDLEAYHNVSRFLADKKSIGTWSSSLIAMSNRRPDGFYPHPLVRGQQDMGRQRRKRQPQEYEPILGLYQYFWHSGRLFIWHRKQDSRSTINLTPSRIVEATLHCFARTTAPIKQLIETAAAYHENRSAGLANIYRPCSAKQRAHSDCLWRFNVARPSWPMKTVILDEMKIETLVSDIKEYLLPATRKWYSQRGIPYRRGYLFHGPPGTSKSSLSFALAGVLNLDIYCLSLTEKSLMEDDLSELFESLPRQCILILEDIDTAGLQRRDDKAIGVQNDKDEVVDVSGRKGGAKEGNHGISLSGLLNAIDGVASNEGRVLIMTTNDVGALDQALLRPGRIDIKIHFGKSSNQTAHNLFVQTYMEYDGDSIDDSQEVPASLNKLAEQFAESIPDAKYTPAEIQGFLLKWKKNEPQEAVSNVKTWVNDETNAINEVMEQEKL